MVRHITATVKLERLLDESLRVCWPNMQCEKVKEKEWKSGTPDHSDSTVQKFVRRPYQTNAWKPRRFQIDSDRWIRKSSCHHFEIQHRLGLWLAPNWGIQGGYQQLIGGTLTWSNWRKCLRGRIVRALWQRWFTLVSPEIVPST